MLILEEPEVVFEEEFEPISSELSAELYQMVERIADPSDNVWEIYTTFKRRFGQLSNSTTLDWLKSDFSKAFYSKTGNGPAFVRCFWAAIEDVSKIDASLTVPGAQTINRLFIKHQFPYTIDNPHLRRRIIDSRVTMMAAMSEMAGYQRGEKISAGGFGVVYRATKKTSVASFEFAIKVLEPYPLGDNKDAHARFAREIRAISKLQHRGVVQYVDAGVGDDGFPFFVMAVIEGESVREHSEGLPHADRVVLMLDVLKTMEYVHAQDVLHRDLKPSNILVRKSDGQPVIIDFGMGYLLDVMDEQSLTTTAAGSLGYIPPEVQANPKLRTAQHDIYSCGVILYEILAGSRPNSADYTSLASIADELTIFDDVIRRSIAQRPSERYLSMREFADDLNKAYHYRYRGTR